MDGAGGHPRGLRAGVDLALFCGPGLAVVQHQADATAEFDPDVLQVTTVDDCGHINPVGRAIRGRFLLVNRDLNHVVLGEGRAGLGRRNRPLNQFFCGERFGGNEAGQRDDSNHEQRR